ncbi:MAG: IPT/TIG domain-containing protein, partial [Chloroflexi bacterium]|nr:IPT/TIG domain-containing protein [Chloroflexota bacterium]
MKSVHMLRLIVLIVVMALLVMAVPVTAQTRSIELDPEEGTVGSTVTVVGEGFNKSTESTDRYIIIYFSSQKASTIDVIDAKVTIYEVVRDGIWLNFDGEFNEAFTVPAELNDGDDTADVVSGTYYAYVCYYTLTPPYNVVKTIRAVAEFTVIGGDITIDPEEGPVGSEVEITGEDFMADEGITVFYDDNEIEIESGDDETDSAGEFVSTILIPESIAGTHTIKVTVGGSEAEAEFTVETEIVLDPTSGEAGAEVIVNGAGFGRRSDVVVYFDAEGVVTDTTSSDGSFDATFTVPELDKGIYDVEAEDDDGNLDTAKFTITVPEPTQPTPTPTPSPSATAINVSAASGKVGSDLIITGAGFAASGMVTIEFGDEILDTVVADASGIFVAVLKVPSAKAGEHAISISDGTNTDEVTFTVEAVPPPIPKPLLPEMGVKAET